MDFDKTPARRYYFGKGIALCVAAAVLLLIPNIVDIDKFGRIFTYALAGLILLMAIYNFWRYKKSHQDSIVYENLATAPSNLQLKYFKKIMILSYFVFPAISVLAAWELKSLDSGRVENVNLWFPLGLIYEHMGYWPTVISPLCLGIICIVIFKWKITKIKTNNP